MAEPSLKGLHYSLEIYQGLIDKAEVAIDILTVKYEGYKELVRINKEVIKEVEEKTNDERKP